MSTIRLVNECMALCKYVECEPTARGVEARWHEIFSQACRILGFNESSTRILWNELAYGNWAHLHKMGEELDKSTDEWLSDFSDDVFYCSDRWTLDRLTRCHWQFRQWTRAVDEEWRK